MAVTGFRAVMRVRPALGFGTVVMIGAATRLRAAVMFGAVMKS